MPLSALSLAVPLVEFPGSLSSLFLSFHCFHESKISSYFLRDRKERLSLCREEEDVSRARPRSYVHLAEGQGSGEERRALPRLSASFPPDQTSSARLRRLPALPATVCLSLSVCTARRSTFSRSDFFFTERLQIRPSALPRALPPSAMYRL